ncbi:MAG: Fur family transcriptional regulator [Myxococcota bacterium]|nr:Fur family transcriptional regulator [Myxococcota bacterium]
MTPSAKLDAYLRQNGLKLTKQRQLILDKFVSFDRHVTPDEMLALLKGDMPNLGLATLYRTMKLFVKAGIAHERRFADGLMRYEYAVEGEHHDHIICTDCGLIIEFEDDTIEERQREVSRRHGILIQSHRLDIYGTCIDVKNCQRRRK